MASCDGVDPVSGEVFPEGSPYQNVDVVRALFHALDIVKSYKPKPQRDLPGRHGLPWEKEEDDELKAAFEGGVSIPDLVKKHQRTKGSISSRLRKFGLVDEFGSKIVKHSL